MEIDKDIIYDLYFNQNMSQRQIAKRLNVSTSTVNKNFIRYGFKARGEWATEDIEFLEDRWGIISVESIAKSLNKSVCSVYAKAYRLNLESVNSSSEYISISELSRVLGKDRRTLIRWIKNKELKAFRKKLSNSPFWRIDIRNFWEWAFKNKELIDWRKFKCNSLGLEPEWVRETRQSQYKDTDKNKFSKWTESQDKMLKMYWKTNKSINEIAKLLNRSYSGIRYRARALGLHNRKINIRWKPIEDEILIDLKLQGLSEISIADELGRSIYSIRSRTEKLTHEGLLNLNNKKDTKPPTKANLVSNTEDLLNKSVIL